MYLTGIISAIIVEGIIRRLILQYRLLTQISKSHPINEILSTAPQYPFTGLKDVPVKRF